MAARPAFGTHVSARAEDAPRRRPLTAFAVGAALAVVGFAVLAGGGALAHGPFTVFLPGVTAPEPTYVREPLDMRAPAETPRRKPRHERIALASLRPARIVSAGGREPVCVRLCDGYFFPLPVAAGDPAEQAATCGSLCPDAPTQVYYRNGSDDIGAAVSLNGEPYSALPVALRYRKSADSACACHRDVVAYAPLRDSTLRPGDAVMTPAGFMVFRGGPGATHAPKEFAALSSAALPSATRGALQAMEAASLDKTHPTLGTWLAEQATPKLAAARAQRVASRALRGDDRIRLLVWRGGVED